MRAYIQAFRGEPWNAECASAKSGFEKFGVECVLFNNTDALNAATKEDVVVGGLLMLSHQLNRFSVALPDINYPEALSFCFGRHIWWERLGDLRKGVFGDKSAKGFPVFLKPLEEKVCTGGIVESPDDLTEYGALSDDAVILCSDPVCFVSEWRCYVRYGDILGICHYRGDPGIECDGETIRQAVESYRDAPAGYAIDLGVTDDGRTLLVEVNDGFAIGNYGLDDFLYAQFLSARWAEIFGAEDVLKDAFALRILERFMIRQRGEVYAVRIESGLPTLPKMGDVFFDSVGREFRIDGIPMFNGRLEPVEGHAELRYYLFKLPEGVTAQGDLLIQKVDRHILNKKNMLKQGGQRL